MRTILAFALGAIVCLPLRAAGQTLPAEAELAEPEPAFDAPRFDAPRETDAWLNARPAPAEPAHPNATGVLGTLSRVAAGRLQLESGYAYLYDSTDAERLHQHTLPDLLLRLGVTERFELRIGWPGIIYSNLTDPATGVVTSSDDSVPPNIGGMFDLWPQQGWLPQTGLLAAVPISLQGNPFALQSLQPLSSVLYSWTLTDRISIGGQSGLAQFRTDGDSFLQFQQSTAVEWAATDRIGTFLEHAAYVDFQSADDGAQHQLATGVSLLFTDRFQVGWRAGLGLNERAPDFVTSVRLIFRR